MEVFKFGGASVKDPDGIKNLRAIVEMHRHKPLLLVISAMGKTTNALEKLTRSYLNQNPDTRQLFNNIKAYHFSILESLFEDKNSTAFDDVENAFVEIDWILEEDPPENHDFVYDQLVSIGELVSTKIASAYLSYTGIEAKWLDARSYIHTDNSYGEGQVDWEKTETAIKNLLSGLTGTIGVTQGFIGGTSENYTTTLGREGSDYSAAIFASCLKADSVTIWKDVPGVLNADPKLFPGTVKYEELSYAEALEMTYFGATVIHPKTIRPLKINNIPLYVKPFMSPNETGTVIKADINPATLAPAIIVKSNQVLISLSTKDFSFITENHLSDIFGAFATTHTKVNMIQNSAISFSGCLDYNEERFEKLKQALQNEYNIRFNTGLQLITIRHFKKRVIDDLTQGKTILMEQFSRNTAQLVLKQQM